MTSAMSKRVWWKQCSVVTMCFSQALLPVYVVSESRSPKPTEERMGSLSKASFRISVCSVTRFGSVPCRTCSLVLGPPGSGKSFVLKRIIQVLKDSTKVLNSSCRKWQSGSQGQCDLLL